MLDGCRLCGHGCGANRSAGEIGRCGSGARVRVASALLHHGEEPPVSGDRGSGTIFFSGCVLSCAFCQNHQISQDGMGRETDADELAEMMIDLAEQGAHNINLVSPTPWVVHIAEALAVAKAMGLDLPVVYNTGGFDAPAALKLMDGLVDVYLPDAKYAGPGESGRYARDRVVPQRLFGAADYVTVNRAALIEMNRQVGPLVMDRDGLARRGMIVRHLVLPENMAGTDRVLAWLARTFGPDVFVSLMAQYLPMHRVKSSPDEWGALCRGLTEDEYDAAMDHALDLGMENVFIQELTAPETYVPDFTTEDVFSRKD